MEASTKETLAETIAEAFLAPCRETQEALQPPAPLHANFFYLKQLGFRGLGV